VKKATNKSWAKAYAKQALSDLQAREILVRSNAPKCHRLHFLQMAAEKTCKAYLNQGEVKKHTLVSKTLPQIARHYYALHNNNNEIAQWELSKIKKIAHEIQVLAPGSSDSSVRMGQQ